MPRDTNLEGTARGCARKHATGKDGRDTVGKEYFGPRHEPVIRAEQRCPSTSAGRDLPVFFGPVTTGEQRQLRGPGFSDHYDGESAVTTLNLRYFMRHSSLGGVY